MKCHCYLSYVLTPVSAYTGHDFIDVCYENLAHFAC
jgi:hypothetical protein